MPTARVAPPVDLSMLLNQAGFALANRLSAALEAVDVSVRVYCVLVKAAEREYTQSEISKLAWLDKTTLVGTLDRMEERGLAERKLSPTDRRLRVVAITPAGRKLLAKADRIVQGVYDEVLGGAGERERAAFVGVLQHLVDGPLAAPFHLEKPARRRGQRNAT